MWMWINVGDAVRAVRRPSHWGASRMPPLPVVILFSLDGVFSLVDVDGSSMVNWVAGGFQCQWIAARTVSIFCHLSCAICTDLYHLDSSTAPSLFGPFQTGGKLRKKSCLWLTSRTRKKIRPYRMYTIPEQENWRSYLDKKKRVRVFSHQNENATNSWAFRF